MMIIDGLQGGCAVDVEGVLRNNSVLSISLFVSPCSKKNRPVKPSTDGST
jgi:hypothetical protein